MKITIIALSISLLFNQSTLDITDYDNSLESLYSIPYLGGNLKPSIQPEWSDGEFLEQIDNLHLQMLRWPGAEAMNYFDWTAGGVMPCYKWEYSPCYPQDCDTENFCNYTSYCLIDGHYATSRSIQSSLLGLSDIECQRDKNFTDNYASHYMNAINNDLDRNLIPFFGLNIVDPEYYNPNEYWQNIDDPYDCTINDNLILYNTIEAQLDTIAALATLHNIPSDDIHIQLTNEPYIESHVYLPWRDQNGNINVDQYGTYVVDALARIRNHPSLLIQNAKVGVFGDVHSNEDYGCEPTCEVTHGLTRCNWNEDLWAYLDANSQYSFDAIAFNKYTGLKNMKIPNFNENTCQEESGYEDVNIIDLNGFGGLYGETDINNLSCKNFNTMNYVMKWMFVDLERFFGRLNGECDGGSIYTNNSFITELTNDTDIDIWVTEYDFGLDSDAILNKPYQGSWGHALHFLYETLLYITEIPNIKLMITNNVNGYSGNYRLIDSYSVEDSNGTNSCRYHTDPDNEDCYNLCENKFPQLSPKGEVMSLLNELSWENNEINRIDFGSDVNSTTISQFMTSTTNPYYTFDIEDLHGWNFPDNDDYLLINISENEYSIFIDGNFTYKRITSDNLFAKNYYKENANNDLGYCSYNLDNDNNCDVDNQVFDYELGYLNNLDINDSNLDEWFTGTASLMIDEGYIMNPAQVDLDEEQPTIPYTLLTIPKHTVVQIRNLGDGYIQGDVNNDNIVNVVDMVAVANTILDPLIFNSLSDVNNDQIINVVDIVAIVNIILN